MDQGLLFLRLALLGYALGFIAVLLPLLTEGRFRTARLTPWLAGAGVAFHTAALFALGFTQQRCPISTLPEVLSALAWASVLVDLAVFWRYRAELLHLVVLPLALVVLFLSKVMPGEVLPVGEALLTPMLRLHLTTIILGVAALSITFAASLAYVIVDRALKTKRPARSFASLPSLEGCDRMGRLSLLWAFPLLTFGIITGAIVNESKTGSPWSWQPRETLSILAWILLGVVLILRVGWGWRGRKAALLTILGFGLVFLRMLGV